MNKSVLAKSIISLFLLSWYLMKLNDNSSKIKELLDDLVTAQKRGVNVKVILEDMRDNEEASLFINSRETANQFSDYFDTLLKDMPEVELKDRYFRLPLYYRHITAQL